MKQDYNPAVQRVTYTSRKIFLSSILIFLISAAIGIPIQVLELRWKWLEILGGVFIVIALLLLAISWITPGVLIIFGVPWFSHAWLRGINPLAVWKKPWTQLSGFQKALIYFWSLLFSGFTLLAIIGLLLQNFRK